MLSVVAAHRLVERLPALALDLVSSFSHPPFRHLRLTTLAPLTPPLMHDLYMTVNQILGQSKDLYIQIDQLL